jgi:hypothetical protein
MCLPNSVGFERLVRMDRMAAAKMTRQVQILAGTVVVSTAVAAWILPVRPTETIALAAAPIAPAGDAVVKAPPLQIDTASLSAALANIAPPVKVVEAKEDPKVVEPPKPVGPPEWRYLGAVIAPDFQRAIVVVENTQYLAKVGQVIAGTKLIAIDPERLTVQDDLPAPAPAQDPQTLPEAKPDEAKPDEPKPDEPKPDEPTPEAQPSETPDTSQAPAESQGGQHDNQPDAPTETRPASAPPLRYIDLAPKQRPQLTVITPSNFAGTAYTGAGGTGQEQTYEGRVAMKRGGQVPKGMDPEVFARRQALLEKSAGMSPAERAKFMREAGEPADFKGEIEGASGLEKGGDK